MKRARSSQQLHQLPISARVKIKTKVNIDITHALEHQYSHFEEKDLEGRLDRRALSRLLTSFLQRPFSRAAADNPSDIKKKHGLDRLKYDKCKN